MSETINVEVTRTALGAGSQGNEGLGELEPIPATADWIGAIKERYGGGEYTVSGTVGSKSFSREITIPGPSKETSD